MSDSASNMVAGIIKFRVFFVSIKYANLGMRNLNDLRAKDLATVDEAEDLDEAVVDLSPAEEIEAAQKEIEALETVLEELESFYGSSTYQRLGCASHKVGIF